MSNPHPSCERLANLAEGLLGALERSQLERHVSECARCTNEVRRMTAQYHEPKVMESRKNERGVLAHASRFLRFRSVLGGSPRASQRLAGALRFDSATMAPAFGIRGGIAATDRQMLFAAGPFEIELCMRAEETAWKLSGQVLGPTDARSGEVRLIGGPASARSILSVLLEFTLLAVPAGMYRLELNLAPDALLHIDSFALGPS
jgi:anti-sigma factor RsiW